MSKAEGYETIYDFSSFSEALYQIKYKANWDYFVQENRRDVIASGGTVHNLGELKMGSDDGTIDQWALEFDTWLEHHIINWDLDALFSYNSLAPNAELAVPPYGREHFIPIFYAMGASD